MNIFCVCTNDETIVYGHLGDDLPDDYSCHAMAYWATAVKVIEDKLVGHAQFNWRVETDPEFNNWQGEHYTRFAGYRASYRTGLVALIADHQILSDWSKDIVTRANQAGVAAMVKTFEAVPGLAYLRHVRGEQDK